jgi:hypothetical protein
MHVPQAADVFGTAALLGGGFALAFFGILASLWAGGAWARAHPGEPPPLREPSRTLKLHEGANSVAWFCAMLAVCSHPIFERLVPEPSDHPFTTMQAISAFSVLEVVLVLGAILAVAVSAAAARRLRPAFVLGEWIGKAVLWAGTVLISLAGLLLASRY